MPVSLTKVTDPLSHPCTFCPDGNAVISAVFPGPSGRFGAPGGRTVRLCVSCDARIFSEHGAHGQVSA